MRSNNLIIEYQIASALAKNQKLSITTKALEMPKVEKAMAFTVGILLQNITYVQVLMRTSLEA